MHSHPVGTKRNTNGLNGCFYQLSDQLDDTQLNNIVGGESPITASRFGLSMDGVPIASALKSQYCGENLYVSGADPT